MESERGTVDAYALASPKNPSAGRQSTAHKLPQHRYARHRRQPRAPGQETLRPPANPTVRRRQGHTGANRACRPNAAHRDTQTTRNQTPSDRERTGRSDQTEDAKAEHERTTEATSEAHRRTPGHAPKGGHPAPQNQRRRRQTHRLKDRQGTEDRHRHRSRKARPAPEQTTRRAQETHGNHSSRTHRRRRQAKPTPLGPTGTKNTATAEKTQKQGQNRW